MSSNIPPTATMPWAWRRDHLIINFTHSLRCCRCDESPMLFSWAAPYPDQVAAKHRLTARAETLWKGVLDMMDLPGGTLFRGGTRGGDGVLGEEFEQEVRCRMAQVKAAFVEDDLPGKGCGAESWTGERIGLDMS